MNIKHTQSFKECYGEWALVAGAAEGIGEAFSVELAKKGINLVMADHNTPVMNQLSEKLKITYGITTIEINLDLSVKDAWKRCMEEIRNIDCRLLVYIPAYSRIKRFSHNSEDELDRYIDLNARTPIHFVHSFINSLPDRKSAGVILMASLAGLIGPPFLAPYAATKAFNILLAESLHSEMKDKNIRVSACCAGETSTPAYWSSNPAKDRKWPPVMNPEQVAEYALLNLGRKAVIIPGWQNRFSYFLIGRLLSRKIAAGIIDNALRKRYSQF